MDTGLVLAFEKAAGGGRNRVMVLAEAVTRLPVDALRTLSVGGLKAILNAMPKGTGHQHRLWGLVQEYVQGRVDRGESITGDSLVFPSTQGEHGAVTRMTVHRIIKAVVLAVCPAAASLGAVRALRALVDRGVAALSAVAVPVTSWLDDLIILEGPPPASMRRGWVDPDDPEIAALFAGL